MKGLLLSTSNVGPMTLIYSSLRLKDINAYQEGTLSYPFGAAGRLSDQGDCPHQGSP